MGNNQFTFFGSPSSQDYDVAVFVSQIPPINEAHLLCKYYNDSIASMIKVCGMVDKPVNSNLAVIHDGQIIDCHKGVCDELNNALIDTFQHHTQFYGQLVTSRIERDKEWKLLRTARVFLSFFSRTDDRVRVKNALRGNLRDKLNILENLNMLTASEAVKSKIDSADFYKMLAFQIGQVLGLYRGLELYTKEEIADEYPLLGPFLFRKENQCHLPNIVEYYKLFIGTIISNIAELGEFNEETYITSKKSIL